MSNKLMMQLRGRIVCFLFSLALMGAFFSSKAQHAGFVKVKNHQFLIDNKPYYYIGTNYWYGGLLALTKDQARGKQRLIKELDFLVSKGINNLRVMVGAEGTGRINGVDRVKPAVQPTQGNFDPQILVGLDFLLSEMNKRHMKAVLYLSNNWEWSGGFLQYVNWNGLLDNETLKRKLTWDEQRDYTSKFYDCEPCKKDYLKQLDLVLLRKNTLTSIKYTHDPAIMAWELANEPRPMRPSAVTAYKDWIIATAKHIKAIDPQHLVTIGSEGQMGTEENITLFKEIHSYPTIDYLTIHIWPKNWGWFKDSPTAEAMPTVSSKTVDYIKQHETIAQELNKPLVIEEFGLPRNNHSFDPAVATTLRDGYFKEIFSVWQSSKVTNGAIAGCNFWAFGGTSRPVKDQLFWKDGDDFSGDPPQEEQGLNAVFDSDRSTWQIIKLFLNR